MSIGKLIYGGFGSILALMAIIATVGFLAANYLGSVFTEYRSTARQSLALNTFAEDLFEARMSALKYRINASEENATNVVSNIEAIEKDQAAADALFANDPETLVRLQQLATETQDYKDAFLEMTALQSRRNELVSVLVETGPKARKQMTEISQSAYDDSDPRAAFYASRVQEELLLGRFYTERYLLTNAPDAFEEARAQLSKARDDSAELLNELQNPRRRELAMATSADLDTYLETVEELAVVISERNEIRSSVLDTVGPKKQAEYYAILEAIAEKQDEIGPAGARAVIVAKVLLGLLALAAIAVGCAIAFAIAKAMTTTMNSIVDQMGQLSGGHLDVEITNTDLENEFGKMADALQVFKDNAAEVQVLNETQKTQTAAAEKQRAVMQSALTQVVASASEGDFKVRMRTDFQDQGQLEIAEGINAMLGLVDQGISGTNAIIARLAEGDLSCRMQGDFKGAFKELQTSINSSFERLSELVEQLKVTSIAMHGDVQKISAGADDLSNRATQQAAALEETSATMEEISTRVGENATSATDVSGSLTNVQSKATESGEIVKKSVKEMSKIEESASRITEIIGVIDGIAFQTNLLALNAAVEAARAGESGKGFAVVASEVRTLAQSAGESAQSVRQLVEESNDRIANGVKFVTKTGEALERIIEDIKSVEGSAQKIANANQKQATGVQEVTASIGNLDQLTQMNASLAAESASVASKIKSHAAQLSELIVFFEVERQNAKPDGLAA